MTTVLSITATDGGVPIYDPDGRWTTWSLDQIYLGTEGLNKYVPKVDDYVVDPKTDERYRVVELDETTMIPRLVRIVPASVDAFSDSDLLMGVGPGTQSDTYRVYIDTSVMPHTLAVDARLKVHGSMATTAKIFKGSEVANTAHAVSAFYDQMGNLLGQLIPLELVAMPDGQNYTVKSVPVCYTTEQLADGEVVTVVFYSDAGRVVSKRQLLVENTAFIRSSDAGTKYVSDISLESPFLSSSDPTLIQYPVNVPLNGLNLMGRVHYSDGTSRLMPVDGSKFRIYGLDHYVATIVGQKLPLVLSYALSEGEVAYGATVGAERYFTESYRAQTMQADGSYSVKLFGYPVYIDPINGYRLEWFLLNLDRQAVYRATPYVTINANTRAFDPIAFGVSQKLSVSVDLSKLSPAYNAYIHTQAVEIVLLAPGTEHVTNWTIAFSPGQDPVYGKDNFAATTFINQNLTKVNLKMDMLTRESWLDRVFYRAQPLFDDTREIKAPAPNFFKLLIGNNSYEFPIEQWGSDLLVETAVENASTIYVQFFKRTPENDLQLGVSGLPVWQQN